MSEPVFTEADPHMGGSCCDGAPAPASGGGPFNPLSFPGLSNFGAKVRGEGGMGQKLGYGLLALLDVALAICFLIIVVCILIYWYNGGAQSTLMNTTSAFFVILVLQLIVDVVNTVFNGNNTQQAA